MGGLRAIKLEGGPMKCVFGPIEKALMGPKKDRKFNEVRDLSPGGKVPNLVVQFSQLSAISCLLAALG